MRWVPRSLAGQLLALLLLALAITHLIAVLMLSQWRTGEQVHPVSAREIDIHVAAVYNTLLRHPDQRASLLQGLSQPDSMFELAAPPAVESPDMDEQEAGLARNLRQRLGVDPGTRVTVHLRQTRSPASGERAVERTGVEPSTVGAWVLDVEVGLPDGSSLRSRHLPVMMHRHWDRVLSFSIPVGLLPIILIAFLFGRRIMRPLRAVTDAASRLSRGEHVERIRPEGPADIRELAASFNVMQERLGRFVSDRTKMIATIGHDLRTPLTSLRIRAELIDDDELREAMIATLDEMSVMAEETLCFARDDAMQEPTRDVDIGLLVTDVVARQRAIGDKVACVAPGGINYRCRPVHLKRALGNLLENAVRHGNASVTLMEMASGQELRIEVEDDGPGIPPDQLEHAFEPFVRLDAARNMEAGGSGLGLAIARSSIRAHGGDVRLENRAEGGLRAVISLPR